MWENATSENLDRPAAQGVAVRLDDPSRERPVGGGPEGADGRISLEVGPRVAPVHTAA
ncbi:hypothetical protein GLX30_33120 [Streptomyces sp. Tu 2975]|uniref:hypothetical protein n=1 Tax=Streptomyces sp. Tu 2975 TaxID=2676871 RepID=UPI0013580CA9|nr:hypothetical protein [Streptomyces sp. Tu 2975]QIP82732.1 hypothetical protein GLX30_33120 [Streptomyces sp. Tu 2975]